MPFNLGANIDAKLSIEYQRAYMFSRFNYKFAVAGSLSAYIVRKQKAGP
jgi:hypothetical protein